MTNPMRIKSVEIYKRGDKSSFLCNPNLITLADPGDYQELDLIKELSNGNVALIFDKNRDSVNQLIRVLKEAFPESNYKNNTHDKCNSIYERKYYYRGVKKDWMSSSSERAADDLKQIKLKHFITQLNNKQNEILRKNQQQECTRQKSFRVSRRKVKATSGSRFVGSEATNIRKRTRIRKSKISGRELLIN